uniref:Small ribosomal subunit protein bS20c n=1 Tax=Wollemia nobilis TaxID=56998 RepID=A0A0C9S4P8_9CONI
MAVCSPPCVTISCRVPPSSSSSKCRLVSSTTLKPTNPFPSLKLSTSFSGFSGNAIYPGSSARRLTVPLRRPLIIVAATNTNYDSALKRHRQSEKRRLYNKSRKSEIYTRMKKVFVALETLRKSKSPSPEDIFPIEKLIAEAYSVIDKAVKVGTLHRNTGGHRKSRLARRKKAVLMHHGWYEPAEAV